MVRLKQIATYLQGANWGLPVCDVSSISVEYHKFIDVISDIRIFGGSPKEAPKLSHVYFRHMENLLKNSKGSINIKFDWLWYMGWSNAKNQPIPLKPGSAQLSLAQVLTKKETA
jgi:hypothetical protein